jgi:L-iditol 2-dehydrogenase
MKVAKYYNNKDIRIEEVPVPEIGRDEILVKVLASGVCGSDVMEWYRIKKAPLVLGHEITGEIVSLGENVDQYKKGDRVFVSHHVPCNTCRYCLNGYHTVCETLHSTNFDPGGYAEYLRVPAINVDRGVFLLPEEMSYEDGSFIEPLACVIRGQRFARFQSGSTVLVMGSGISGILHIALAHSMGAGRVIATDINDLRLESALRFGADVAFNAKNDISSNLLQANENRKADLVIICTGALSAFTQALQLVDRGGTVLFFAPTEPGVDIPLPVNDFWRNGITLIPSYGASPRDISEAMNLIRARKVPVHDMITHRFSLAESGQAFQLVAEAADSIKVIIEPHRK